ncbi:hypothetical protein G3580_14895 [Nitrogeniibacter mangrovi]|uniref:Uncharacterized protein n=1 Tax=Nitrogeniibacter mangrovi TaxID=2016596 RepID=A0A6C1B979_9RHOO|nr:hypothetical protein [Nitrogeniibacter mangrovi]QID18794.1 hypothetical protein G3580_14895 [Nitrogeniibacter mangrovi]
MRHVRPIALGLALLALGHNALAQGPLGRLFFTPEEREAMDRNPTGALAAPTKAAPRTLDGIVRRSDGKATVWIDGLPQPSHLPSPDAAPVEADDGRWLRLKVGESTETGHEAEAPRIRIERKR